MAWIKYLFDLTLKTNEWDGWVKPMVAKANMTSIRENLVFRYIVQDESLNIFCLHKFLVDCDEFWLILKVIEHRIIWHA